MKSSPIKGYAKFNDSQLILAGLTMQEALSAKSVKIESKTITIDANKFKHHDDHVLKRNKEDKIVFKKSTWAIDLDGDGHADIFLIESPLGLSVVSYQIVKLRQWFVNINGQWFKAGKAEDADCT